MSRPLADRMRPTRLEEVVGQRRWLAQDAPLRRMIDSGRLKSIVLWGPPGCGKTTIARALAAHTDRLFLQISAVLDGVKELRGVIERARVARQLEQRDTVLFVDEIHRWNKAQQDALLPHVEGGDLVLIGATTENPSFELNAALRSRLQVIRLEPLNADDVAAVLERALAEDELVHPRAPDVDPAVVGAIAQGAAGDARRALDDLERCIDTSPPGVPLTVDVARAILARADIRHDKSGTDHFDVVSALIKSMRGSDPQAALYWLARMIAAGEDPMYICRRLVVFAAEDIGNADPRALQVAVAATQAVQLIGLPEGRIPLAQAVTWLATCPKSNAAYVGIDRALEDVRRLGALPVPPHLRSADNRGYRYPHDAPHRVVAQSYLPEPLGRPTYYEPTHYGDEKLIAERLAWWRRKLAESPND